MQEKMLMNIPLWARRCVLAAGLMMAAGSASAFDLLVNHNAVPTEATGPAGGQLQLCAQGHPE